MKNMKDFNEIYEEVLQTSQKELEELRKKCLYRIVGSVIAAIICAIAGICFESELLMNGGIFICIVIGIILIMGPNKSYKKTYKEKVVKKFIKSYDENLEYCYEKGIPVSTYREGGFESFDRYYSEDLIIGNIDGHDMMIGEVHTEDESTDDEGHKTYTTIFHGLFGLSNLNNSYNGMIKIHADKGFLSKVFDNKKRIEMDSSEFEKYFDVIADDKIQAMQILTSDVMDRMLKFTQESKIKFELTIKNNKLYIRFRTGGMFEGNIIKSSVDFDTLKKVFDIINFTFGITRALVKATEETEI